MNKTLLAMVSALTLSTLPQIASAQTAAPAAPAAAEPEASPLSFNLTLTTDYRYRGISQTRLKPAIQGGVDYALPGGFYVGAWASTIKWIKDAGGEANAEVDLYGGYKGEIAKDFTYDVGFLRYQYPSNKLNPSANTNEIYGAVTFGPATLKYSHSLSNLFGFADSKNSGYVDLSATFEVGTAIQLIPHVGYQRVAHNSDFSYADYSFTVGKDFSGFFLSATFPIGTNAKKIGGVPAYNYNAGEKDLGKTGLVVAVKKTF
jgi:uncharacterized protein (TIGR02001 family)